MESDIPEIKNDLLPGYVWYREIESGQLVQISIETWESMKRWEDYFKAKVNPDMKIKGIITIIGTMRDEMDSLIGISEEREGEPKITENGLIRYFAPKYTETDKFGNIK